MAFIKNTDDELKMKSNDNKVVFDPIKHTYKYNDKYLLSVTQFIKLYCKDFNPLFPSISKSKKNKREKTGITDHKLLRKYWRLNSERSTSLGTAAHVFAEMYMLDRNSKIKTGYDKAVVKAIKWLEDRFEIVSQEEIVYHTDYMLAGSCDLVLKDKKTGEYALGDWKTTEDMFKSYNKLLTPFSKLKDSAINKYSIQLDIYSMLYNRHVPEYNRYIIQLFSNGDFSVYYPKSPDKKYVLPYTLKETKKAISKYMKENIL